MKNLVSKKVWIATIIVLLTIVGIIIAVKVSNSNNAKSVSNQQHTEEVSDSPKINASVQSIEATPTPKPALSKNPEITSENIFNNGSCAIQGDRIYFCNNYDDGTLYSIKNDGSDIRKLNDDWTEWFNVSSNLIYYQNGSGNICSMYIDGSSQQELNHDNSGDIHVVGDRIYYSNADDDFKLYSMNTDGSDRKKLNDDSPLYMNVVGDRIYYSNELNDNGTKGIYSIKTDGSKKTKLSDDCPFKIVVKDGWIYFNNQNDNYKLYAMKIDGSDRRKLMDDYAPVMNVVVDRIYYQKGDEWSIYSVKTDGSDRKLLTNDNPEWFAVWGDTIYYTITGAKIYSMKIDGSDKRLIVDLDEDTYKDVKYEISTSLNKSMSKYRFVATGLVGRKDDGLIGYVMGLKVYDENNKPLLSEDFSEKSDDIIIGNPVYNEMMDTMGLHVVDVNFDGYKDVIILNDFSGAHGNTWYNCWLWDVKTSSFVASKTFADICNPAIDHNKKCIYSAGGSGASYWGGSIYKFIHGKFVVTNDLDTYGEGLVEKELVNGKMKIVREVKYGADDKIIGNEQEYYAKSKLWQLNNSRWYWVGGHHADKWLE